MAVGSRQGQSAVGRGSRQGQGLWAVGSQQGAVAVAGAVGRDGTNQKYEHRIYQGGRS